MGLGYLDEQPTRAAVDDSRGVVALEFGQNWCGYCRAMSPFISAALAEAPEVQRIMAADGSGLPLGRSFGVKLWPTLIVLRDGVEVARVVRPSSADEVQRALARALPRGEE